MRELFTGLQLWNLLLLAGFFVLGVVQDGAHVLSDRAFQLVAVFAAVFCVLVHSLLVIHFIGSMKWIQQSTPTAGLSEDESRRLRRAWIKGALFPLEVVAMCLAVAVAILSGGTLMAALPAAIYLGLAALSVALNALVLPLARRAIGEQKQRLADIEARMEARIAAGQVAEAEAVELLPESGRAGGKVFVFLALNVWVLYGYHRFVLRDRHEPLWPYAVACGVLLVVGVVLLRRYRGRANNATSS